MSDLATDASITVSSPTAPAASSSAGAAIGPPSASVIPLVRSPARTSNSIRYRLDRSSRTAACHGTRSAPTGTSPSPRSGSTSSHTARVRRPGLHPRRPGLDPRCPLSQAQPGHLQTAVAGLGRRQGVTVSARVARPVVAPASPPAPAGGARDVSPLRIGVLGMAVALATAAVTSFLIRRAGRERVAAGGPPTRRGPRHPNTSAGTPRSWPSWRRSSWLPRRSSRRPRAAWCWPRTPGRPQGRLVGPGRDRRVHRPRGTGWRDHRPPGRAHPLRGRHGRHPQHRLRRPPADLARQLRRALRPGVGRPGPRPGRLGADERPLGPAGDRRACSCARPVPWPWRRPCS